MCMSVLPVCASVHHKCAGAEKVMNLHVSARNRTWILCKGSKCSQLPSPVTTDSVMGNSLTV